MSNKAAQKDNGVPPNRLSPRWQLVIAVGVAVLLVALKWPGLASLFGISGSFAALMAVASALLATCLLINWIGTAAPALLFMSVFLVMAGYVPRETAATCLKVQLADPFVIIVFSGFALITLMFGLPSESGTPPVWAMRPGEMAGRAGERLRSLMGRFCLRVIPDRRWARMGALLPGLGITLISSVLGSDAMARMAAIRRKSLAGDDVPGGQVGSSEYEQNAHATVFVLLACVLAPALIPVSLWGLFFTQTAGTLCPNSGVNGWLLFSYPSLMVLVLPFWFLRQSKTRLKSFVAYGILYVVFWVLVCALAIGIWWSFGLLNCPADEFKSRIDHGKENLAQGMLALVVVFSAWRVLRRCWQEMRAGSSQGGMRVFSPLKQWASKVEWELIKGGFSRALGVVVIVVFAAIFREVIKGSVPTGTGLPWLADFPFSALVVGTAVLFGIGISIGTAFGTFVLGVVLFRIIWPDGFHHAWQTPILFGLLVSISAAINQISPQADNVDTLSKYLDKKELTSRAYGIVLAVLGVSVTLSFFGWIYCLWDILSWIDLTMGVTVFAAVGSAVVYRRPRFPANVSSLKAPMKPKLIWIGVVGQSASDIVAESRLAGDFIANYDVDNDSSNVAPESAVVLLRMVPLTGPAAWGLSEQRNMPDTLLLLISHDTSVTGLFGSPLIARALHAGHPVVRVMKVLPDNDSERPVDSKVLQWIGGGEIKNCSGSDGLRTLSRDIVACLDYREEYESVPPLYAWLFPSCITKSTQESPVLTDGCERSPVL
jgi:hypothetical protein